MLSKGASQHNQNYNIGISIRKYIFILYIILNEYTLKRINQSSPAQAQFKGYLLPQGMMNNAENPLSAWSMREMQFVGS